MAYGASEESRIEQPDRRDRHEGNPGIVEVGSTARTYQVRKERKVSGRRRSPETHEYDSERDSDQGYQCDGEPWQNTHVPDSHLIGGQKVHEVAQEETEQRDYMPGTCDPVPVVDVHILRAITVSAHVLDTS